MSDAEKRKDKRSGEDEGVPTASFSDEAGLPARQIGPYKLLSILGEGGYGIVYLAERLRPVKRRVALKVIKPGMDTKQVIARFEAERQALALLEHPNIAHVFNAGTTEAGRPYFVMEYVKGVPITEHCDRHKLTIEERLNLFLRVCEAVQHAHQKGIIHRDIKPSNVQVSIQGEQAVPKVIDFGVAKAISQSLTERTLVTEQGQFIGTPEYMSPEQAEMTGQDVDTRSDIYSLGVVLYELLTGALPFDPKTLREGGVDHIRYIIREEDPKTPSTRLSTISGEESTKVARLRRTDVRTLGRKLHGDLDWITIKAMEKDRTRRYQTAHALAEDIERHLNQEPVLAGPPSAAYKVRKFVIRNKSFVYSVATIAVILVLATVVSISQMIKANRAAEREQITAAKANKEKERALRAEAAEVQQRQRAKASEKDAREKAYASDMNLAAQALSASNLGRARYLLNRHRPSASHSHLMDSDDLRGWEWRYLWQQCRSDALYEFCQRTSSITSLSVSHDGRLLAIGEREGGGVSIWNLATREKLTTFSSHERYARVAFSPRDTLLAFSTVPNVNPGVSSLPDFDKCYIRLWDGKTERIIREFPLAGSCFALKFSEDGRSLVSLSRDKITVWSIPEGKRVASFPAHSSASLGEPLAINPNKTFAVYVARGHDISLIDLVTGQERWTATTNHDVTAHALSKDSRILASGAGYVELPIRLWDVESGKEIGRLEGHRSWVTDLHFPPDGRTLMSASADQTIRVWDVSNPRNGKLLRTFRGHTTEVWRIALLPDNRTLVSGGKDGSVCVWDTQKRPFDIGPVIRANMSSFQFTPAGSGVLTVDRNGCVTQLHDPGFRDGHVILNINTDSDYFRTLISADNRLLAAPLKKDDTVEKKNGTIEVWDLQNGTVLHRITCRPSTEPIAFLAQGRKLVTFERNGDSHDMWDLTTGQHVQSWAGAAKLHWDASPALTTDGRLMLTLSFFKVPGVLRDMTTGHQTYLNLDIIETSGVSFSPNGELLAACSHQGFVKLCGVETFREVATLKGFLLGVHSVAFSPDGQRLAAGSDAPEAVKIWDVETLQELITLPGEEGQHHKSAFSPDGDTLGTINMAHQLHLWRAPSWEEIERAEETSPAKAIRQ